MKTKNEKIDLVVMWVDGSDPKWRAEKEQYTNSTVSEYADGESRFRDWDLMRYWFRGIEKHMPFINKVFFITWGHLPEWLDTSNERLVVVNHRDYMPEEYLPTYNSSTIELNIHRIKGLSENFILFNDDYFVIAPTKEEMFFKNNLPCDMLHSVIFYNYDVRSDFWHIPFNDLGLINKHFSARKSAIKNFFKWVNPVYGPRVMFSNLIRMQFSRTSGFRDHHLHVCYKKSTFKKIWDIEGELLDKICRNKFRTTKDVNQWLMRYRFLLLCYI